MKLVNIRNDDIADGNPKLTLGLIWTIILHFQVGWPMGQPHANSSSCQCLGLGLCVWPMWPQSQTAYSVPSGPGLGLPILPCPAEECILCCWNRACSALPRGRF